jgi:benzoate transport
MNVAPAQNASQRVSKDLPSVPQLRTHDDGKLNAFRIRVIAVCTILQALDGFDVLSMAFAAPALSEAWQLSASELGLLISAALVGMASGSLLVAPLGDRFGRRPISLLCLSLITLGMLLSAFARNAAELGAFRVLTGIGVGGLVPTLNVITAEYAPSRWRSAVSGLQATGYPIGATIGGGIATFLIATYSWRAAFLFGGLASALMLPVVACSIPESMEFLAARRPARALDRLNALRRRMHLDLIDELPQLPAIPKPLRRGVAVNLPARSASALSLAFFFLMLGISAVQSWTPKLLIDGGLSQQQGLSVGVVLNLGGIFGGLLVSVCAVRFSMRRLEIIWLALGALLMALFGWLSTQLSWAFGIALVMGVALSASIIGLCALGPTIFPAQARASGMGVSIGVGRIGAILAPLCAGALLDHGWKAAQLYYIFAVPIVLALLSISALPRFMSATDPPSGQ